MHHSFEFKKKHDEIDTWSRDASQVVTEYINEDFDHGYYGSRYRSIEQKTDTTAEVIGNLCDFLISKGLIKPEEFLEVIGLERHFKVEEKKPI